MDMFFTKYNPSLFLIAVSLSVIITFILLFSKPENKKRSYFLSIFLLIISVFGLEKYLFLTQGHTAIYFKLFSLTTSQAGGACIYLYLSSYWRKNWSISVWKYFLPFLIIAFFVLIVYIFGGKDIITNLNSILKAVLLINYVTFFAIAITDYRKNKDEASVNQSDIFLIRLIVITMIFGVFSQVIISFNINFVNSKTLNSIELFLIFIIYWVAFFSYLRTKKKIVDIQKNEQIYYKRLKNKEITDCLKLLKNAFEKEKLFLNPELNLQTLSKNLNVSPRLVSVVLNQKLNRGFNDFLNEYRIAEAQKLLKDSQKTKLTIAAIGYESGFNSLATFQRNFKKITGKTPKEFLEK